MAAVAMNTAHNGVAIPAKVQNWINGKACDPTTGKWLPVTNPLNNSILCQVAVSAKADVEAALDGAEKAGKAWRAMTMGKRCKILYKFRELMTRPETMDELSKIVIAENGKNYAEAYASCAKGVETIEWACSMPQIAQGKILGVSRGITCHEVREPLGTVACIAPFNFPVMVPMWTVPIALAAGNCVIFKPSEKCPVSVWRMARIFKEAGLPDGVFQVVNGTAEAVMSLCDAKRVNALTFVGSSRVAGIVSQRCRANNKKVLALGGAKNHLVAMPDCDIEMTARDVMSSFAGCAGQRCMAASVLLTVGSQPALLDAVVQKTAALLPGQEKGQMGPIIDAQSASRITRYINEAEAAGAKILLDGRKWSEDASRKEGNWVGPTIILHSNKADAALHDEIFGPVLSVLVVDSAEEAIAIENANQYGNAACIYTQSGGTAEWFSSRFNAGMIGVNIGIPVPREPFSFGGMEGTGSKYGDCDITGEDCLAFMTKRRKITTKWSRDAAGAPGSGQSDAVATSEAKMAVDHANFNGQM